MSALSKQYEGKVEFEVLSAKTEEGMAAVKKYELDARKHGIVMLDAKGEVSGSISGHNFGKEQIEAEVKEMLK